MKDHAPISQADLARSLLAQIQDTATIDRIAATAACDAALDIIAPKTPECSPLFDSFRDEALWWTEFATDTMRAEMLAACLRHVATMQINTASARKRALVAIWNSMNQADKDAFLEFVDPGSKAEV